MRPNDPGLPKVGDWTPEAVRWTVDSLLAMAPGHPWDDEDFFGWELWALEEFVEALSEGKVADPKAVAVELRRLIEPHERAASV